jgi:hypothetical protein
VARMRFRAAWAFRRTRPRRASCSRRLARRGSPRRARWCRSGPSEAVRVSLSADRARRGVVPGETAGRGQRASSRAAEPSGARSAPPTEQHAPPAPCARVALRQMRAVEWWTGASRPPTRRRSPASCASGRGRGEGPRDRGSERPPSVSRTDPKGLLACPTTRCERSGCPPPSVLGGCATSARPTPPKSGAKTRPQGGVRAGPPPRARPAPAT